MRQTFLLLRRNWKPLIGFELAYHMLTSLVLIPVFYALFQLSIRLSGLTYLSTESFSTYLRHPAGVLLPLLLVLVLPLVAIFNMAAVVECFHAAQQDEDIGITQMLCAGGRSFRRIWSGRNILLLPFVALLVPLSCLATNSGYHTLHEIPSFILDFIWNAPLLAALFIALLLLLLACAIRLCFCVHIYTMENGTILDAVKKSISLTRGRFWRTTWQVLLWQGVLLLAAFAFFAALALPSVLLVKLIAHPQTGFYLALFYVWLITDTVFRLFGWFAVSLSFARFSVLYRTYQDEAHAPAVPRPIAPPLSFPRSVRRGAIVALCVLFTCNVGIHAYERVTEYQLTRDLLGIPAVSAHRGDSLTAPENSIPAFQSAIALGADWIELDVHQTKDGVVVVAHDADLKRIAGVKKSIWNMTYAELTQYDVGSWFSPEYSGLRLATLDEVLKLCKGKIKLNIELKPTGHEEDFEQNVVDLVLQNGFEGDCVLASLNAECLRRVEECAPQIRTLYNMAVATGRFVDIPYVDGYSIEYSFVTKEVVHTVKTRGKDLFIWTVNTPSRVEAAMKLGVDNIITDDPTMAKAVIYDGQVNDTISSLVALLFPGRTGYRAAPERPATAEAAAAQM